jgi:hypothetical protein
MPRMPATFPELPPHAQAWAAGLPDDARPVLLAARYPGVVALLSTCWSDAGAAAALIDELLAPMRGKGGGFERELIRLRSLLKPPASALAETDWCARLV